MREMMLVVLLVGCGMKHEVKTNIPVPDVPDFSSCKLLHKFASHNVAVVISTGCSKKGATIIAVSFREEDQVIAGEEASNIIPRLLKYKPVLAPILNTYIGGNGKDRRAMILFLVVRGSRSGFVRP